MQSDTVVGIVGAIVLVSVMVGVFAYEYNATGDAGDGDGGTGANQTFERLAGDDDIDGDGVPNAQDDDVDGDGVPNAEDDSIVVEQDVSGSVPQSRGSAQSDEQVLAMGQGVSGLTLTLTYERPTPLPGTVQEPPGLDFTLTDPNGESYASQQEAGGDTVTVTFEAGGLLPAGEWTLTASSNSAVAPAMSYEGTLVASYDDPTE